MTTPSQHGNKHPSYAQHAVSTPITHLHTPSISTPRSMPSPAVHRSGASKPQHPANPQNASKTSLGGAPMSTSLSQISNVSNMSAAGPVGLGVMGTGMLGIGTSPSTNLLSFASPAGLAGLDMSTPSAMMDGGGPGAHAMNLSLSDLGIHSGKRNEDEERRVKMDTVLGKLLGKRKRDRGDRFGRVSEEGVTRVGRWAGLDVDIESKWQSKEFEGRRPVQMAGKIALLVEFEFDDSLPTKAVVSYAGEESCVMPAHEAAAAAVLFQDLTPAPGVASINTRLDCFAANLQTLAQLDKLSLSSVNCFAAISGVYTSLQKLYQHEKEAAIALLEAKGSHVELKVEREVICKKSGRPRMHTRRKIGLHLDYWMEKRHVIPTSASKAAAEDEGAMDIDSAPKPQVDEMEETIYSVEITAQSSSPELYPAVRISSKWIGERILVPSSETTSPSALFSGGPSVDWQDPPPTYVSATDSADDAMNIEGAQKTQQQKLPNARFVAKLQPPLVMPWGIANQILQTVGDTASADMDPLKTYETLLLERLNVSPTAILGTGPAATSNQTIFTREGEKKHHNALFVPKQDFVYELKEIPFAHPRQIIAILPTLRQWACFGSLIRNTFVTGPSNLLTQVPKAVNGDGVVAKTERKQFSLAELLTPPESPDDMDTGEKSAEERLPVDISLSTSPTPGLDIIFPLQNKQGHLASLNVGVLADADIVVTGQNLLDGQTDESEDAREEMERKIREMGRALEITGNVGLWIEWLRRKYGS